MSGGRNIYRLLTNKIYSPMVKSLTDYSIVPLLIIIYYFIKKDFQVNIAESNSIPIFIINLILSLIIVFFCCVYNELFVLYCCKLEYNTYCEVSRRASQCEKIEKDIELQPAQDNIINLSGEYIFYVEK